MIPGAAFRLHYVTDLQEATLARTDASLIPGLRCMWTGRPGPARPGSRRAGGTSGRMSRSADGGQAPGRAGLRQSTASA